MHRIDGKDMSALLWALGEIPPKYEFNCFDNELNKVDLNEGNGPSPLCATPPPRVTNLWNKEQLD
jgi:hypothetical protein